uniref:Cytochrome b n=1 Tax=Stygobromus allegheniensis TaxID=1677011 RepID=A0A6C0X562_9CRUS|nr:cytochrome b [Stygobromus allegheniensis]QIC54429.1 cytochrome b [Stygobromus allegheniensis]
MKQQYSKSNPLFMAFDSTLVTLPTPPNISYLWNLGSLLSMCLIIQLISGVLLASIYSVSMDFSFSLVSLFMETSDKSWLLRYLHANGASLFFICLYAHIGRGIYYSSFLYPHVWNVGVMILILTMATAFMGYVLPINQMSFWGAAVITNLFSEIPYIGPDIVKTLWGGVSISNPTIMRFFTFHFLLPFLSLALVIIHITLLHMPGSNNPLGIHSNLDKIYFNKYFVAKDMLGATLILFSFLLLVIYSPLTLGDDENFTPANAGVTPHHIQPEWYFLFAYAILRSIPNKLGGVIALLMSIMFLYVLPYSSLAKNKGLMFYPINKIMFWLFCGTLLLLSWIGSCPVEEPFYSIGQLLTVIYFSYYLINPLTSLLWDKSMLT